MAMPLSHHSSSQSILLLSPLSSSSLSPPPSSLSCSVVRGAVKAKACTSSSSPFVFSPVLNTGRRGRERERERERDREREKEKGLSRRRFLLVSGLCGRAGAKEESFYGGEGAGAGLEPIRVDRDAHPPTTVHAPGRRIIAVGDLHGDLIQTRRALRVAGLLNNDSDEDKWMGGHSVLVQVGDILDRGEDEIAIMSLLHHLNLQARPMGGAVFQVLGNHETMNVAGDFRYVDPCGFEEAENFVEYCENEHNGDWKTAFLKWRKASQTRKSNRGGSLGGWVPWNLLQMQKGVAARSLLFSPGGPLANELSQHGVVLKVNGWLFAHGGILPHHVDYGLERMNKDVSLWMSGARNNFGKLTQMPFIATRGFDSVVWSRFYSRESFENQENIQVCAILKAALSAVGAQGLVVGHTPQTLGANCECDGQIWRIDVGMSHGVMNARPQVIEIVGSVVRVVSATAMEFDADGRETMACLLPRK